MTHSRSDISQVATMKVTAFAFVAVFVVLLQGLGTFGALVTTDRYIVTEDERVAEDQYVTSMTATIEGTIDGDLTIFSGSVTISGSIVGNLTAFSSATVRLTPSGSVGGSVNGAGQNLTIEGEVGGDVFFAAGTVIVEEAGSVGRDVIAFGGTTRIEGAVGRDVRGRSFRTTVDGTVGGDVDIATSSLGIGPLATIEGDVLYRSSADASIDPAARIVGTVTKLPAQSNFLYGIILSLANVVGFLGFLVAGLVALWLARGVGSRAVGAMLTRPIRSLLAGIAFVILLPLSIGLLAVTLVGIPLAIVGIALGVVAFIIGPVPAVAALGNRIMVNRGGLFGAFLVGAVLWRLGIWLIPVVGGAIYVLGLVWGLGAWVLGAFAARRGDPTPAPLIPASLVAREDAPAWEPPLAPGSEHVAVADDAAPAEPQDPPTPDTPVSEESTDDGELRSGGPAVGSSSVAAVAAAMRFDAQGDTERSEEPDDANDAGQPDLPNDDSGGATDVAPDEGSQASLDERLALFRKELEEAEPEDRLDPATAARFAAMKQDLEAGDEAPVDDDERSDDGDRHRPAPTNDGTGGRDADPGSARHEPADGDGADDWGLPRS